MKFSESRELILFAAIGALYIASEPLRPYPLHYVLKAVPIFILLQFIRTRVQGPLRIQAQLALLFSAGGDIMLSMAFPNQFIAGLSSFLVAQLIYGYLFLQLRSSSRSTPKIAITACTVGFAVVMANLLLLEAPALRIAVLCYLTVISAMAIAATWAWRSSLLHVFGAFMFICSDALIAWNMFRSPVPFSSFFIMSTYYAAQLMLVTGILRLWMELRPHQTGGAADAS